jgi:predicted metallo-beta-lactamase superfamily hydrolase
MSQEQDEFDLDSIFAGDFASDEVESLEGISSRKLVVHHKRDMINRLRKETAAEIVGRLPKPGEAYHIVSNGSFDYWQVVVAIARLLGRPVEAFRASTWTMNRGNVLELLKMIDEGTLREVGFLTGIYFKRRESAVYATLMEGLIKRKQRLRCLENHAKVAVFIAPPHYIVLEGSANFTANPRIEQNMIVNCQELAEFHKAWIDEVLSHE